jgi:predicted HTH transcriptional regulator
LYRKSIRVVAYKKNNRIQTEREFLGRKGYAFAFIKLIDFLDSLLPKSEIIEKAIRKEITVYPILALRELIANSLIHQDFSITGTGPLIEIFQNRIEITNPGIPLIDTLRFIDHIPQSRNESLAYLMKMLNICEERGSGIDKVIASTELYQLPPPEFIQGPNFTRVILFAPRNLRKMEKRDKIRACYQHCVLKYVSGYKMTNATLRNRFQIEEKNYPIASRILADTIKSNLIKDAAPDSKSKKHTKYIPFWA